MNTVQKTKANLFFYKKWDRQLNKKSSIKSSFFIERIPVVQMPELFFFRIRFFQYQIEAI